MGFFKKFLRLEPNLIKLLSARIVADEDFRYFTLFSQHHPQLKTPEYVRINLHYYAKVLFNFGAANGDAALSAVVLKDMVQMILNKGIAKDSNLLHYADIDDVVTIVSSPPVNIPREIGANLFFVDSTQRHITTDVPRNLYAQHMVFSVPVLLQATLDILDEYYIDVLYWSLSAMNEAYDSGQDYSNLQNLSTIPTNAFLSTLFGSA